MPYNGTHKTLHGYFQQTKLDTKLMNHDIHLSSSNAHIKVTALSRHAVGQKVTMTNAHTGAHRQKGNDSCL